MKIHKLTSQQIRDLAPLVPTSEDVLRHIVSGRRGVTAARAIAIERAAGKLGLDIRRESLNEGCKRCEFARTCRSKK